MATDPEKVLARLHRLEARNAELTSKADGLERENRELRALPKALRAAEVTIEGLRESAAAAQKSALAAEVRAREYGAEVARLQAKNATLQGQVDRIKERDALDREIAAAVGRR